MGLDFDDLGRAPEEAVDYPDYARKVAEAVAGGRADQGLLVCGSGTGMAITANKVSGVRAAVAWSEETARLARQHNDANVLAIGARTTPHDQIPGMVRAWFDADFEGGRHAERVEDRGVANLPSRRRTIQKSQDLHSSTAEKVVGAKGFSLECAATPPQRGCRAGDPRLSALWPRLLCGRLLTNLHQVAQRRDQPKRRQGGALGRRIMAQAQSRAEQEMYPLLEHACLWLR